MSKISRRDFLKASAVGAGVMTVGAFLDACGGLIPASLPPDPIPTLGSQPSQTPLSPLTETTPALTDTLAPSTDTPLPPPDLVVASGGEPEPLVRQAIAALGGMEKFIPIGANVVIKPNICVAYRTFEYAATTNPYVVGTLVKMAFEAGAASVKAMDSPFGGTQQKAYQYSGIKEQVEAAGGEMAYMLSYRFVPTENPAGISLKRTSIYEDILKADVVINVPIAKHHDASRLTIGMKNLMGMVQDRSAMHVNLGQSIADLNALIKPQLTIIDAIRILTAHGPQGGNLDDVRKLDTIVASADVVAADSFAASLFGLRPEDLDYIVIGTAMGLGRSDLQNLNIRNIQLAG